MRSYIETEIKEYVKQYQARKDIQTTWRGPIVGFADASSDEIMQLRNIVVEDHQIPDEILKGATVVISYFIPFTEDIGKSNEQGSPGEPSRIWAKAYDETNKMMAELNAYMILKITEAGYRANVSVIAGKYSDDVLKSRWSQRHIARLAGLGTFGINNMLITKKGCCGRYNSIVADVPVEPDFPLQTEYCLYKLNGSCRVCIRHCTEGALTEEGFDRYLCHKICSKKIYGNETCGKCVVNLPCTYKVPALQEED